MSHSVDGPDIAEAVEHIDALWDETRGGWGDVPGAPATTAASFAVIMASHTMRMAWPFDPAEQLGITLPRRSQRDHDTVTAKPRRTLYLIEQTRTVRIDDQMGDLIVETKIRGNSQWAILWAAARRQHEAKLAGSTNQDEMAISLTELSQQLTVTHESIEKTVRRLHAKLAEAAQTRRPIRKLALLEDHVFPGTQEPGLAFEEVEIEIVSSFPTRSPTQTSRD
jgi:hypothetical protein